MEYRDLALAVSDDTIKGDCNRRVHGTVRHAT